MKTSKVSRSTYRLVSKDIERFISDVVSDAPSMKPEQVLRDTYEFIQNAYPFMDRPEFRPMRPFLKQGLDILLLFTHYAQSQPHKRSRSGKMDIVPTGGNLNVIIQQDNKEMVPLLIERGFSLQEIDAFLDQQANRVIRVQKATDPELIELWHETFKNYLMWFLIMCTEVGVGYLTYTTVDVAASPLRGIIQWLASTRYNWVNSFFMGLDKVVHNSQLGITLAVMLLLFAILMIFVRVFSLVVKRVGVWGASIDFVESSNKRRRMSGPTIEEVESSQKSQPNKRQRIESGKRKMIQQQVAKIKSRPRRRSSVIVEEVD